MIGAILGGLTKIGEAIGGKISQNRAEKRQREHEMKMYQMQKQDNIDFWNLQNQYNDPAMLMDRLKNAGLNPNLAYGNPETGGQAQQIQSPKQSAGTIMADRNPLEGVSDTFMNFYQMKQMQAQTNLLEQKQRSEIINSELNQYRILSEKTKQDLQKAQTRTERATLEKKLRDYDTKTEEAISRMRHLSVQDDATRLNMKSVQQQMDIAKNEEMRKVKSHEISLKQGVANILETYARISDIQANTGLTRQKTKTEEWNTLIKETEKAIQDIQYQLAQKGWTLNTPPAQRQIDEFVEYLTDNLSWEGFKNNSPITRKIIAKKNEIIKKIKGEKTNDGGGW